MVSPLAYANSKHMGKLYDSSKPDNTILYVDAYNLYGWAVSQSLPTGGFECIKVSGTEN